MIDLNKNNTATKPATATAIGNKQRPPKNSLPNYSLPSISIKNPNPNPIAALIPYTTSAASVKAEETQSQALRRYKNKSTEQDVYYVPSHIKSTLQSCNFNVDVIISLFLHFKAVVASEYKEFIDDFEEEEERELRDRRLGEFNGLSVDTYFTQDNTTSNSNINSEFPTSNSTSPSPSPVKMKSPSRVSYVYKKEFSLRYDYRSDPDSPTKSSKHSRNKFRRSAEFSDTDINEGDGNVNGEEGEDGNGGVSEEEEDGNMIYDEHDSIKPVYYSSSSNNTSSNTSRNTSNPNSPKPIPFSSLRPKLSSNTMTVRKVEEVELPPLIIKSSRKKHPDPKCCSNPSCLSYAFFLPPTSLQSGESGERKIVRAPEWIRDKWREDERIRQENGVADFRGFNEDEKSAINHEEDVNLDDGVIPIRFLNDLVKVSSEVMMKKGDIEGLTRLLDPYGTDSFSFSRFVMWVYDVKLARLKLGGSDESEAVMRIPLPRCCHRGCCDVNPHKNISITTNTNLTTQNDMQTITRNQTDTYALPLSISQHFTNDNIEQLIKQFSTFDTNGDGTICPSELHTILTSLKIEISMDEINAHIKIVDHDSSGSIEFSEFVGLMHKLETGKVSVGGGDGDNHLTNLLMNIKSDLKVHEEIEDIMAHPIPRVTVKVNKHPITPVTFTASIVGPKGTPYFNYVITLTITIPSSYPYAPPVVKVNERIIHLNFTIGLNGGSSMPCVLALWDGSWGLRGLLEYVVGLLGFGDTRLLNNDVRRVFGLKGFNDDSDDSDDDSDGSEDDDEMDERQDDNANLTTLINPFSPSYKAPFKIVKSKAEDDLRSANRNANSAERQVKVESFQLRLVRMYIEDRKRFDAEAREACARECKVFVDSAKGVKDLAVVIGDDGYGSDEKNGGII